MFINKCNFKSIDYNFLGVFVSNMMKQNLASNIANAKSNSSLY